MRVFEKANQDIIEEGKRKKVVPFIDAYKKLKLKRAGQIIKNQNSPIYKVSFQSKRLNRWIFPKAPGVNCFRTMQLPF